MQTLNIAEQNNADLKKMLADEEHARRSADSALEGKPRIRGNACVRPLIS